MSAPVVATGDERRLLRHALATIAYRASRVIVDAPQGFAEHRLTPSARTPIEIVAHLADLMAWALTVARGADQYRASTPSAWDTEVERFFASLARFDEYIATDAPLAWSPDRLLQAPIADALTHVGQLALLRRAAGDPIRGEHYGLAKIEVGRVGCDQPAARVSID